MTSSPTYLPVLERIAEEIERMPGRGRAADCIPALAARDVRAFGMAVAEPDGTAYGPTAPGCSAAVRPSRSTPSC